MRQEAHHSMSFGHLTAIIRLAVPVPCFAVRPNDTLFAFVANQRFEDEQAGAFGGFVVAKPLAIAALTIDNAAALQRGAYRLLT